MGHVRIWNLRDGVAAASQLEGWLIDIAAVVESGEQHVLLQPDEEIDLANPSDLEWLLGLLQQILQSHGETEARLLLEMQPGG